MPDQNTPLSLLDGLKQAAEAAGWDVEWNWRDTDDDGTEYYDLYLWPAITED